MTVTLKDVRDYFKDYPDDNPKHLAEFFVDSDINLAIRMANDRAEKSVPLLQNFTASMVPDHIMLEGIVFYLVQIKMNNLAINQSVGVVEHGVQLSIGEEYPVLRDIAKDALASFRSELYTFKKSLDFRNSMGDLASPYNTMTGRRGSGSCGR